MIQATNPKTPFLSRKHKWLISSAGLLFLVGLIYFLRVHLLVNVAEFWIVREPIERADAIVVLGGGLQTRPFEAARLYLAGYAPRILVMDVEHRPSDTAAVTVSETVLMQKILLKKGVPEGAITTIGTGVSSNHEEAIALREWVRQTGARSVIIPTELFHTRRVSWFFSKELRGTEAKLHVQTLNAPKYTATNWWEHEQGVIAFQTEIVKFCYYLISY